MVEYVTKQVVAVCNTAREQAGDRSHGWLGVSHLWAGLLQESAEPHCDAVSALIGLDADPSVLHAEVVATLDRNPADGAENPIPRGTPRVRYVLLRAVQIAFEAGRSFATTGDLLMSLTLEPVHPITPSMSGITPEKLREYSGVSVEKRAAEPLFDFRFRQTPASYLISEYARQIAEDDPSSHGRVRSDHFLRAMFVSSPNSATGLLQQHGIDATVAAIAVPDSRDEEPFLP